MRGHEGQRSNDFGSDAERTEAARSGSCQGRRGAVAALGVHAERTGEGRHPERASATAEARANWRAWNERLRRSLASSRTK
ncbi:hypothetical protein [Halostella sp. PRR32]|uniref:hypothetical protein n=1 Tax=Halostella sp. PRR32 TaxID=3098147 RepID=UPI002B1DA731|nr:hypothetical protein [Halostella sp. PRR32]